MQSNYPRNSWIVLSEKPKKGVTVSSMRTNSSCSALSDTLVRDAVLSPDGRYIAFVKGNNLYLHKLDFGTEVAITHDENPEIINGIADWLYEEEFGATCMFAFSPDSKQLAFVRFDETRVPTFSWQEYLGLTYPREASLRYPKDGFGRD